MESQEKRVRIGGRKAGTPNRITAEMREAISDILSDNVDTFKANLLKCKPNEFCQIYVGLFKYVIPTLSSVQLKEDENARNGTVEMLIRLRDGLSKEEPENKE